jgi:serine phosphatase RsbU (regulator of sigma subunit)
MESHLKLIILIKVVENNFNLTMNELDQKIFEKLEDFKGDQRSMDDTAVMSCKFYLVNQAFLLTFLKNL